MEIPNQDSPARKGKERIMFNIATKLEIIKLLENGYTAASVGRVYNVNESSIRTIKKNSDKIKHFIAQSNQVNTKMIKLRNPMIRTVEKTLADWVEEQYIKMTPVGAFEIRTKALELYKQYKLTGEITTPESFQASKGWFHKFIRRQNIIKLNSDEIIASEGRVSEVSLYKRDNACVNYHQYSNSEYESDQPNYDIEMVKVEEQSWDCSDNNTEAELADSLNQGSEFDEKEEMLSNMGRKRKLSHSSSSGSEVSKQKQMLSNMGKKQRLTHSSNETPSTSCNSEVPKINVKCNDKLPEKETKKSNTSIPLCSRIGKLDDPDVDTTLAIKHLVNILDQNMSQQTEAMKSVADSLRIIAEKLKM